MGRKQGETDLRVLQRHVLENEIQIERIRWLRVHFHKCRHWTEWAYKPMPLDGFQVMVNEVGRAFGIKARYRGR